MYESETIASNGFNVQIKMALNMTNRYIDQTLAKYLGEIEDNQAISWHQNDRISYLYSVRDSVSLLVMPKAVVQFIDIAISSLTKMLEEAESPSPDCLALVG